MAGPKVSVIMPFHGSGRYLNEAIASLLEQTLAELELIIISEPRAAQDALHLIDALDDARVVHLRNDTHLGLVGSLNRGIGKAQGGLLARLDSDDVCAPDRLERQLACMTRRHDIDILGTSGLIIDESGKVIRNYDVPLHQGPLKWGMLFDSALLNSSVMIRREVFEELGGYSNEMKNCEDYEFWSRAWTGHKMINLPDRLVYYREHPSMLSMRSSTVQAASATSISKRLIEGLLAKKVDDRTHELVRFPERGMTSAECGSAAKMVLDLFRAFKSSEEIGGGSEREVRTSAAIKYWSLITMEARFRPGRSPLVIGEALTSEMPFYGGEVMANMVASFFQASKVRARKSN